MSDQTATTDPREQRASAAEERADRLYEALRAAIKATGTVIPPGTPDDEAVKAWEHVMRLQGIIDGLREDGARLAADLSEARSMRAEANERAAKDRATLQTLKMILDARETAEEFS